MRPLGLQESWFFSEARPELGRLGGRPRPLISMRLGWRQKMEFRLACFPSAWLPLNISNSSLRARAVSDGNHLTVHPPIWPIEGGCWSN